MLGFSSPLFHSEREVADGNRISAAQSEVRGLFLELLGALVEQLVQPGAEDSAHVQVCISSQPKILAKAAAKVTVLLQ